MKHFLQGVFLFAFAAMLTGCTCQQTVLKPELKFSGRMGQSQPAGEKPFTDFEAKGVVQLPDGKPGMLMEGNLYSINSNGTAKLICPMTGGNPICDGKNIYTFGTFIQKYEQRDGKWVNVWKGKRFPYKNALTVARVGDKGFGEKGKFFTIDWKERKIYAYDENLNPKGCVLTLPEVPEKNGRYSAICLLPGCGDMLIAGYYPTRTTYRYKVDGSLYVKDGWPLTETGFTNMLPLKGGAAAMWNSGNFLTDIVINRKDVPHIGDGLDIYMFGMVPDEADSGWFAATSTGVKYYPADMPNRAEFRFGGPGKVLDFAVNGNNIIVSLGSLLYCMKLDDVEDSPVSSAGNEPWRMGGCWTLSADAVIARDSGFFVWSKKTGKTYQFEPFAKGKKRWTLQPEKLNRVTALADNHGKILYAEDGKFASTTNVSALAVCKDLVLAADRNAVTAIRGDRKEWTAALLRIKSLAILKEMYAAAADGINIYLIDLKSGKTVYQQPCKTSLIRASGKWLIAYDDTAKVFYRYKLTY